MTKSRLTLVALMMGLSFSGFGCKKLFKGHGGSSDAGIDMTKLMAGFDASALGVSSATPADTATAMASATATTGMPDTSGGGASCSKAVKCCKVLSGDNTPACDSLTRAPEVTCATTLTSYRKAVKATKPKRLSECD